MVVPVAIGVVTPESVSATELLGIDKGVAVVVVVLVVEG